jgi:type IV secretory pathway TraG/TraD family ATPase VirD4
LPTLLADSGGKGIQIIPVTHGEAQLRTRWQADGAQVIFDTCGTKIFLPGITDTATLQMASELCGQAAFKERSTERGQDRTVWHDVMTPHMIRQLPPGHALVIRGGLSPVIARLGKAWKDPAYKAARRRGLAIAALTLCDDTWPADTHPLGPPGRPRLAIAPDPDPEDDPPGPAWPDFPWS